MNGKVAVAQRGAIVSGIRAGITNSEIAGFNSIPISTVKKISKLYNDFLASGGMEEDFDIQRKAHRRRSDNMREDMVEVIEDMVDVDPGVSMRAIARELGCSEKLVRTILTQELRYKSYRLCKGQFMNQATKERRLVKAKALLNRFKHPPSPNILNLPHFWEKEVWPPSSPDVNPLDFYVWGVAERDTNRSPHNTKDSLISSIMEVFSNIPREDVIHACSRVRSRLEEIIEANGDFIR